MNSFEKGNLTPVPIIEASSDANNRAENIMEAQERIVPMFEERLGRVTEIIGENPYIRDFGERF